LNLVTIVRTCFFISSKDTIRFWKLIIASENLFSFLSKIMNFAKKRLSTTTTFRFWKSFVSGSQITIDKSAVRFVLRCNLLSKTYTSLIWICVGDALRTNFFKFWVRRLNKTEHKKQFKNKIKSPQSQRRVKKNYFKVTLHTKTFPTMPIMWRLVGGNPVFWGDKGETTK
jgi:hypothetical protein